MAKYPDLTRFIDRQREYAELLVEVMSMAKRATEEGVPS